MTRDLRDAGGLLAWLAILLAVFSGACSGVQREAAPTAVGAGTLANSAWRLVEFQSMDDATGTVRPGEGAVYTMQLRPDGTVSMQLDCNRATGRWSAEPAADGRSGSFAFGPLAATRALCPPPNLGERITGHAGFVRSFLLQEGRLYLSLLADGGIYVWERIAPGSELQEGSGVVPRPREGDGG